MSLSKSFDRVKTLSSVFRNLVNIVFGDIATRTTMTSIARVLIIDGPEHYSTNIAFLNVINDLVINILAFPDTLGGLVTWFKSYDYLGLSNEI